MGEVRRSMERQIIPYLPPHGRYPDMNDHEKPYDKQHRNWVYDCETWWRENGFVLDGGPFYCVACGSQLKVIGHMTSEFLGCPKCGEFTLYFFDIVHEGDKVLAVYRPEERTMGVDPDELEQFKQSLKVSRGLSS